MTVELARYPAYVVPTILVPSVFFLFFIGPGTRDGANARMATFAGFAAIGVSFFQFGVGIAADRESPWELYLRTLPVGPGVRLLARAASAAIFASLSAGLLIATALAVSDVSLQPERWGVLVTALLLGTIPFACLGTALGYWSPAKAALPIANLLYLVMSFAGGLWSRPGHLPEPLRHVSELLPTRALADVLLGAVAGAGVDWPAWGALAGFTAAFAWLAVLGYRRDEGRRFS